MTVHGAKGLEAPVVVVIDGCEPLGRNDPPLLPLAANGAVLPPVWSSGQDAGLRGRPATARAALLARARQEHNRLLYVAMTRAADRLIVAPFRGHERETETAWCRMVQAGLEAALGHGPDVELPYGPATLWHDGERRIPRTRGAASSGGATACAGLAAQPGSAGAGVPDAQSRPTPSARRTAPAFRRRAWRRPRPDAAAS